MKHALPFLIFLFVSLAARGHNPAPVRSLTLAEARATALAKHPRITIAELQVLAAHEQIAQNRAAYLPSVTVNAGAVDTTESNGGIRAAFAGLPLSGVHDRVSASVTVSQLITDFGRTSSLTASSRLRAAAQEQNNLTTRALVTLEVDSAYYGILQAGALLNVAEQAVKTRTLLRDNTAALQKNQLKSALDVSFAEVNLQDAELLISRSRNDLKSAHATLARLLLDPEGTVYHLAVPRQPGRISGSVDELVQTALHMRPELDSLRFERDAAWKFAQAERALNRPSLSLQGTAGVLPYRDPTVNQNYAAAGIVLNWPIVSGGLNTARRREAELRALAAEEALKDEEASIRRDVQLALLNATNALERATITSRLREQAGQAFTLAEARYNAGSASVIELSQAQLTLTTAEITETTTRYEYLLRHSMLDFQTGATHQAVRPRDSADAKTPAKVVPAPHQ